MLLYILRHGEAETEDAIPDEKRALTTEGTINLKHTARAIVRMELRFDEVYCSPLLRARQTAEIILKSMKDKPKLTETELLVNGADFGKLFSLLGKHSEKSAVLLVGHEPYLSRLISMFIVGNTRATVEMKKGGLACVHVHHPVTSGLGELRYLLTPHLLRLLEG